MDRRKHDPDGIAGGFRDGNDGGDGRSDFAGAVHRGAVQADDAETAARQGSAAARPNEEEQCAVILSVICEELRADPADIQIKSIRKL